jgi:hypothetical protein
MDIGSNTGSLLEGFAEKPFRMILNRRGMRQLAQAGAVRYDRNRCMQKHE